MRPARSSRAVRTPRRTPQTQSRYALPADKTVSAHSRPVRRRPIRRGQLRSVTASAGNRSCMGSAHGSRKPVRRFEAILAMSIGQRRHRCHTAMARQWQQMKKSRQRAPATNSIAPLQWSTSSTISGAKDQARPAEVQQAMLSTIIGSQEAPKLLAQRLVAANQVTGDVEDANTGACRARKPAGSSHAKADPASCCRLTV